MSGNNEVNAAIESDAGSGGLPVMMLPTVTHPAAIIACVLPTIFITSPIRSGFKATPMDRSRLCVCASPHYIRRLRGNRAGPPSAYEAFLRLFPRGINTLIRMAAAVSDPARI